MQKKVLWNDETKVNLSGLKPTFEARVNLHFQIFTERFFFSDLRQLFLKFLNFSPISTQFEIGRVYQSFL